MFQATASYSMLGRLPPELSSYGARKGSELARELRWPMMPDKPLPWTPKPLPKPVRRTEDGPIPKRDHKMADNPKDAPSPFTAEFVQDLFRNVLRREEPPTLKACEEVARYFNDLRETHQFLSNPPADVAASRARAAAWEKDTLSGSSGM